MKSRRIANKSTVGGNCATDSSCIACDTTLAQAELIANISLETKPTRSGRIEYVYKIENASNSGVNINAFVLNVGPAANLESLRGPIGWAGDYNPLEDPFGLAFVSCEPQYDIPVGRKGSFTFTSPLDAEPLPYFIANLAPDGLYLGNVLGEIESPAVTIPDPPACLPVIAPSGRWRSVVRTRC